HERLRVHARASSEKRARDGAPADLLDRVAGDSVFGMTREEVAAAASAEKLIGRAAEQVEVFGREELDPALAGVPDAKPGGSRAGVGGAGRARPGVCAPRAPAAGGPPSPSRPPPPPPPLPPARRPLRPHPPVPDRSSPRKGSRPGTAATTASRGSRPPRERS